MAANVSSITNVMTQMTFGMFNLMAIYVESTTARVSSITNAMTVNHVILVNFVSSITNAMTIHRKSLLVLELIALCYVGLVRSSG